MRKTGQAISVSYGYRVEEAENRFRVKCGGLQSLACHHLFSYHDFRPEALERKKKEIDYVHFPCSQCIVLV